MAKEEKEEKQEDKLVMVGDGADAPEVGGDEPVPGKEEKDEKSQEEASTDDGEEGSDERVGHSEDEGEDREAIRERRRLERKNRREKDARLRREVEFLRTRNEALEREQSRLAKRQDDHENLTIEQRINQVDSQIKEATRIHTRAVMAKDEETAVEAASVKDQLAEEKARLEGLKEARSKDTGSKPPANGGIDPDIFLNASSWVSRNKEWFDPQLRDERSAVVRHIEGKIYQETGLRPSSPEYWEELDRRVAKRFPDLKKSGHAADDDDDTGEDFDRELDKGRQSASKKKPSGPKFSVGGRTRALRPGEVFISAERRQAMEEAGVWEDQELRERYLKSYQRYDEEAAKNSRTR